MRASRFLLGCALALTSACAGATSFGTSFPLGGSRLGETLQRAKASAAAATSAVIVGVADAPRSVFAYDLRANRLLFRANADVTAVPAIAGALVAVPEAGKVTVRRLQDGSILHTIDLDGMRLIGAGGDAHTSAIVLSTGGTMNTRSKLVILHDERVTAERKIDRALGVPAVLGGITFVPHNRVNLSAVDTHGNELARVRSQDDVASDAFTAGGEVFFGQRGFYRLDSETERGAKNGAHYWKLELKNKLPGAPPLLPDSTEAPPAVDSALHRVRLSFAPASRGPELGLADDTLYLVFYKQVFGLAPDASTVRWVHETENDVVGMQAVSGGVLIVESTGELHVLDSEGVSRSDASLGLMPIAVTARAETLEAGAAAGDVEALADRLARAARNPDTRLVPSRAFVAEMLGTVEDDRAAQALIDLCSADETPTRVRDVACETLSKRTFVSDAVLSALNKHANFLDGTKPPPVGALALAAAHAKDARAVSPLVEQLQDPATAFEELAPIVRALANLGDASAATPLSSFVRLYHAETTDEPFENLLALAMDAVVRLDRERARSLLDPIASDVIARAGVRTAAQKRLNDLGPAPRAEGEEAAPEEAKAEAAPAATPPEDSGPPTHLTSQHVEEALAAVRTQLQRCVHDAPQHPASARLVIVVEGDGKVSDVRALPESVQACAAPLVRTAKFPETRFLRRSIMSYSVTP